MQCWPVGRGMDCQPVQIKQQHDHNALFCVLWFGLVFLFSECQCSHPYSCPHLFHITVSATALFSLGNCLFRSSGFRGSLCTLSLGQETQTHSDTLGGNHSPGLRSKSALPLHSQDQGWHLKGLFWMIRYLNEIFQTIYTTIRETWGQGMLSSCKTILSFPSPCVFLLRT